MNERIRTDGERFKNGQGVLLADTGQTNTDDPDGAQGISNRPDDQDDEEADHETNDVESEDDELEPQEREQKGVQPPLPPPPPAAG